MKRMIREELIQKISELDVEELASAVAKAENSLQLPSEAPASKKMVVINTSGEQEQDDIPSGAKLYKHEIVGVISGTPSPTLILISTSNEEIKLTDYWSVFTNEKVIQLTLKRTSGSVKILNVVVNGSSASTIGNIIGTDVKFIYADFSNSNLVLSSVDVSPSPTSITDTITEL